MGFISERTEAVFDALKNLGRTFLRGNPKELQVNARTRVACATIPELKAFVSKARAVSDVATMDGLAEINNEHLADYQRYADGLVDMKPDQFTGPLGLILKGRALQSRDDCERLTRILMEGRLAEAKLEELGELRKAQEQESKGKLHKIS